MGKYSPPNVTVEVLENTRIINLGEGVRIPAVIGVGPTRRSVFGEQIQRSSGVDYLKVYPAKNVIVSSVRKYLYGYSQENSYNIQYLKQPQLSSGILDWEYIPNEIGNGIPAVGNFYYVDYSYDVPNSQFEPLLVFDKNIVNQVYGSENNTTGILATACNVILENGSPGLYAVQVTTSSVAAYNSAIDKLKKIENISDIIVVFPKGFSRTNQEQVISYAISHLEATASEYNERSLIYGSPGPDYATGGFDIIGDKSNVNSYIGRANLIKNKDVTYVVPSVCYRNNNEGETILYDGNLIAAAIAGRRASRPNVSIPLHGAMIYGLTVDEFKWTETEMNLLGAANCTVVYTKGGLTFIRDHITTDPTSADTQEPSIRDQERLVKRSLRKGLMDTFIGKGVVVTPELQYHIQATTEAILKSLVNEGSIYDYGKEDNPLTGETKIVAIQSKTDPRRFEVHCSVKYLYPLKWINVSVSIYI